MAAAMDQAGWQYRPLRAADLTSLEQALPALLGGHWSRAALEHLLQGQDGPGAHQCRVLGPPAASPGTGSGPGEVLAFAEFVVVLDECQLLNLAVLPAHQRQGLGTRLLAEVLQDVKRQGCSTCVLELRRSNATALRLYEAAGFRQLGLRRGYYPPLQPPGPQEDALLLSCRL